MLLRVVWDVQCLAAQGDSVLLSLANRFNLCVSPPPDLNALTLPRLKEMVVQLLNEVAELKQTVAQQRDEIARLKGLKGRPEIKPSGMENATSPAGPKLSGSKPRRGKVRPRVSVGDRVLKASAPPGSRFKGYETYQGRELVLSVHAIRYRRERWVTPDGQTIIAPLPEGIDGHFGPDLRLFVLMQYHQGQTTLPRLTALLQSVDLSISKREVHRLLTEKHEDFLDEARDVLHAGLETSPWTSVDDTCARHKVANGFCTQIGNERFTWFRTWPSKSRLHFLDLLAVRPHLPSAHRLPHTGSPADAPARQQGRAIDGARSTGDAAEYQRLGERHPLSGHPPQGQRRNTQRPWPRLP
jgi:hypothetical protein